MMPDIQYLLLLQKLREMTGGAFDEIFNAFSKISVDVLIFLPFIIYWAVSKEWGKSFIGAMFGSELVNAITKLTVCAYRPWIRSDLIQPAGDSKTAATGYSFPSGHTNKASSILGTAALWQYKKQRWISILCVICILLIGFSRNFLGVHTPQDVICGFLISVIAVFAVGKISELTDGNEKLADILTLGGILFVVFAIIYVQLKSYPLDYVDGKLLVDPVKMQNDFFKVCGSFLALMTGLFIDRHFIHYEIPVGHKNLPVLTAIGTGICFSWKAYFINPLFVKPFGGHWGNLIGYFITTFFVLVIFPIIIQKFTKSEEA